MGTTYSILMGTNAPMTPETSLFAKTDQWERYRYRKPCWEAGYVAV